VARGAVLVAQRRALDRVRRRSVASLVGRPTGTAVHPWVRDWLRITPVTCSVCETEMWTTDYATSSYYTPDGVVEEPVCADCVDRLEDEAEAMRKKNGW
jgi:hypothetical protein